MQLRMLLEHGIFDTNLISGPVNIKDPENVKVQKLILPRKCFMHESLPVDIAILLLLYQVENSEEESTENLINQDI